MVLARAIAVIAITGTVACISLHAAVAVESTAEAMRVFGLVGTWSYDCAHELGTRRIFAIPLFGPPTINQINRFELRTIVDSYTVEAAARVTEDKIKIIYLQIGQNEEAQPGHVANLSGKTTFANTGLIAEAIEKQRNKIRVMELHVEDKGFPEIYRGLYYHRNARNELHRSDLNEETHQMEKCLD
jgi:hypothetical protein